jgi:predicted RNase H-like HicB family nuclease
MKYTISVILEKDGDGWFAHSLDLPGCQSSGGTLDETLANIREAAELYLQTMTKEDLRTLENRVIVNASVEVKLA